MKLVAMLRIKNQILTIRECLQRLSELVDEIVIVDNGSTDGTIEIYSEFPKIVKITKTTEYHDGRDRNIALEMAKQRNPDWILFIDGDEMFESGVKRAEMEKYMQQTDLNMVQFRMFNFWLSKRKFRIDGIWKRYTAFPQRQMWRNHPQAHFANHALHMGGIKNIKGKSMISPIRIKHYGYISKKMLAQKKKIYEQIKSRPRADKSLPLTTDGMIRCHFWESENRLQNSVYQYLYLLFWQSMMYWETVMDLTKNRISQLKLKILH